jgi:hypothetical protein
MMLALCGLGNVMVKLRSVSLVIVLVNEYLTMVGEAVELIDIFFFFNRNLEQILELPEIN